MEGIDGYEIKLYLVSARGAINPPQDDLIDLQTLNVNFTSKFSGHSQ